MLTKIRIVNFRSIESMSIDLGMSNLLIGQNNTGKSNFLRAINIAVGGIAEISELDVFVGANERLEKSKPVMIDIMFQPTNAGEITRDFSDFWTGVFTEEWITTDPEGNFVGIRAEIKFDILRDNYVIERRCIHQWGSSAETASINSKKVPFNEAMRSLLLSFYMDANRDIVQDLRNKKSYFGRVTSSHDLPEEEIEKIEEQLSSINAMIINSIPTLQQTKKKIEAITETIGATSSSVEIEPLARKLSDLNKGMDIVMQDGNAGRFPISQHGSGTRSWISFLTLSAFVDNQNEKRKADDEEAEQFIMLTMEEPEAHLHPQAQRQLFSQISNFSGQKIISTHSPSIVAQSVLADAIYFSKKNGKTMAVRYKAGGNVLTVDEKIVREVINTRADILFASAVILCEGITEELSLPVYFYEYFGCAPFSLGVSIIDAKGVNNYKPYLSLMKNFEIPWFIFSDGENKAIEAVASAIRTIFNIDYTSLDNISILGNGDNYEKYLVHEGYSDLIIEAICEYEGDEECFNKYVRNMDGEKKKGGENRNYTAVPSGHKDALIDLCLEGKTKYALPVSKKIVSHPDKIRRVPTKIAALFSALATKLGTVEAGAE